MQEEMSSDPNEIPIKRLAGLILQGKLKSPDEIDAAAKRVLKRMGLSLEEDLDGMEGLDPVDPEEAEGS